MRFVKCIPPGVGISIGLFGLVLLFSGWAIAESAVKAGASYSEKKELEAVYRDLEKVDAYASQENYLNASVIVGRDIKARSLYRNYLKRAAGISENLLTVRQKMDFSGQTLTLQQLGALTQGVSAENLRFRDGFLHGEEHFYTYRLIQKAITNLEDAIYYWRTANHYRTTQRGTQKERLEDDEILRFKLQTAMNAIDELSAIIKTRDALNKDLTEE